MSETQTYMSDEKHEGEKIFCCITLNLNNCVFLWYKWKENIVKYSNILDSH